MNHTVSVIVPVYNVERYLTQCMESILNQVYSDLDIIMIDDGSTDTSGFLCDKFAEEDPRVRVVHQQNGGAASAKNTGLRMATGEYLAFVDSDDVLVSTAFDNLVTALEENNADVVQGSFCKLFVDGTEEMIQKPIEETGEQFLVRFTKDWTCGLLWDKVYRRSIFDNIFFVEGNVIDDEFFTYRGIMNAAKVIRISEVVYQYRQRKSGVMASDETKDRIILDKLHYLQIRRKNVVERFPSLGAAFDEHYLNMLLILSHDANASEKSLLETKQALKAYFRGKPAYRPPFSMRLKLAYLRFTKVGVLLRNRDFVDDNLKVDRYFV